MQTINLPVGLAAPADVDCVRIQQLDGGLFSLEGSVLATAQDPENPESLSLLGGEPYADLEAATAAGLSWASEHGAKCVYVSISDGITPLPAYA